MNLNSLRIRVTAWYVGLLAAALLVFSATVYFGVRGYLRSTLEHSLSNDAHAIASNFLSLEEQKGLPWMTGEIIEAFAPEQSGRFIRITRQDNTILYQSGDTRDPFIESRAIPSPSFTSATESFLPHTQAGRHHLLLYSLPYASPSGTRYVIQIGASLRPIEQLLRTLLRGLLLVTPLILVAAAFGGHALMSRPLAPLIGLSEKAERIGTRQLGERLPVIATGDELERLSLSLNRMIARLEDSLNQNRRFSADVSHELRTPLTILRGELEQLLRTRYHQHDIADTLASALDEIDRMTRIVENLLVIARLDSGTDLVDRESVDLDLLTRTTVDQMHLLADEKHITITHTPSTKALILADPARIKQVLVNLLDNAIKYTSSGGTIEISIDISGTSPATMATLTLRDTGIGIPPASLPHVFDRFYRADKSRTRESGGTGLGLSIVQAICHAHNGTVTLESIEASGTTVKVELPLAPAAANLTIRDTIATAQLSA